jgi:protein gp37
MPPFQDVGARRDVEHFLDAKVLQEVLRRRKPTKFFWCDMSDMFGDWVPDEWIAACFGVMAATPQHTHQVLTKRAERMREWFEWMGREASEMSGPNAANICAVHAENHGAEIDWLGVTAPWPLPNVWLGVSAEDQQRADERIPHLLATPAAVRFVSAEPLIGRINLLKVPGLNKCGQAGVDIIRSFWVIVGGESGPGARPCDVEWIRDIVRQCRVPGVPVFVKQLGKVCVEDMPLPSGGFGRSPLRPRHSKGGDPAEWSNDLRVREFPR